MASVCGGEGLIAGWGGKVWLLVGGGMYGCWLGGKVWLLVGGGGGPINPVSILFLNAH